MLFGVATLTGFVVLLVRYWYVTLPVMILSGLIAYVYETPGRIARKDVAVAQVILSGGGEFFRVAYSVQNDSKYVVTDLHFVCDGDKETIREARPVRPGHKLQGVLLLNVASAATSDVVTSCYPKFKMRSGW